MYIKATTNLTIKQVLENLMAMTEWDSVREAIIDEDFDSSAPVSFGYDTQDDLCEIHIKTAWSGFSYAITGYNGGTCSITYSGAWNGFLAQNLLPGLGEVVIQEADGEYATCSRPEMVDVFAAIRKLAHSDIESMIAPLRVGDLKPSRYMKERLGLSCETYGGWITGSRSTGNMISVWATPERHAQIAQLFTPLQERYHKGIQAIAAEIAASLKTGEL